MYLETFLGRPVSVFSVALKTVLVFWKTKFYIFSYFLKTLNNSLQGIQLILSGDVS